MFRSLSRKRRFGFTLVEVLVTTVVVGVMAAVVIPAMVKQTTAGDAPRLASDLSSVKAAIGVFSLNVKPRMPGDIEDLINTISTTEKGLDGTIYTSGNVSKWEGPYIEWPAPVAVDAASDTVIFKSGGSARVHSGLFRCPGAQSTAYSGSTSVDGPCLLGTASTGDTVTAAYGAVKVTGIGLLSNEFLNLNEVIDGNEGANDTEKQNSGLLRQNASGTIFFLAVPFSKP